MRCIRIHILAYTPFRRQELLFWSFFLEICFESQVRTPIEECIHTFLTTYANLDHNQISCFFLFYLSLMSCFIIYPFFNPFLIHISDYLCFFPCVILIAKYQILFFLFLIHFKTLVLSLPSLSYIL